MQESLDSRKTWQEVYDYYARFDAVPHILPLIAHVHSRYDQILFPAACEGTTLVFLDNSYDDSIGQIWLAALLDSDPDGPAVIIFYTPNGSHQALEKIVCDPTQAIQTFERVLSNHHKSTKST